MKILGNIMKTAIAYIRASTNPELQKNSFAIQEAIINNFADTHGYDITKTFVEYCSGGKDDRPEFNKALNYAITNNCTLINWKVDRLSRSMSIFARIQDHLHLLRFCEIGDTEPNVMVLGVLLGVAHSERINTSVRVKAAYKTLKAQDPDKLWGNPNIMTDAQPKGLKVRQSNAAAYNLYIQSIVNDLKAAGYCTLKSLVIRLNQLGIKTRRGSDFNIPNLHRLINYEA